jgi:Arc/MetJ-type ribon-helix-helix transcriptional regulator
MQLGAHRKNNPEIIIILVIIMAPEGNTIKVSVKKPLAKRLHKRLKDTEFKTLSEYVNFILEEVINSLEEQEAEEDIEYTEEEEEKVKQRLRDLGYLD